MTFSSLTSPEVQQNHFSKGWIPESTIPTKTVEILHKVDQKGDQNSIYRGYSPSHHSKGQTFGGENTPFITS